MTAPIDSLSHRSPVADKTRGSAPLAKGAEFSDALRLAGHGLAARRVRIEPGDTLRGMVRQHVGADISEHRLTALVKAVAQANGLSNPNLIIAGKTLDLSMVSTSPATSARAPQPHPPTHPVLSKTLDRAVDKGYIPARERQTVEQRIVGMGKQYGFAPDDFARMVLMESDGLNPKASNGRCHGIIQFCEGHSRGADSVGLRGRAHEIARMSVAQQLNLVERYFNDVGLTAGSRSKAVGGESPRLGLDDLYLSVLTPSARQEARAHVPLPIAGDQAKALYVGNHRDKGITRQSLTQGLQQHALRVLRQHESQQQVGNAAATQRQQFAARNSYVEVAVLDAAAAKLGPSRP